MRGQRGRLLWPLLLLAACIAAGVRLYDEWQHPPNTDVGASAAAGGAGAVAANGIDAALALPPPTEFAVIAERPLFAQSRRPPPPAPPPAPEPPPPPAVAPAPEPVVIEVPAPEPSPPPTIDFALVGIVTAGGERHALVRRQADGAVVEITEGGDISGWFAVLIDPERAVFRQGSAEEELVLKYDAPVPPEMIPARTIVKQPPTKPAETEAVGDQPQRSQ